MDMKQLIAERLATTRKSHNLTLRELSEQTGQFSVGRISNWEQASRSPGPAEAKVLAEVLDVAPSYLLGLCESPGGDYLLRRELSHRYLPIIPLDTMPATRNALNKATDEENFLTDDKTGKVLVSQQDRLGPNAFATTIADNSMEPALYRGDIVIIDPDVKPQPGRYVFAYLKSQKSAVLRRYRELNHTGKSLQLCALNEDWADVEVKVAKDVGYFGGVVEVRRKMV